MNFLIKNSLFLYPLAFSILTYSCQSANPDKQGPQTVINEETLVQNITPTTQIRPKVNILFVVDNSGSMKPYQEKLSKNIKSFAQHFFNFARVDYKIGIVPIYDSKYLHDTTVYKSGQRVMNSLGELVPLKGRATNDTSSNLYITPETINPEEVLEQTVMIGTQWGPEAEESFSPVLAVADTVRNKEKNLSFYDDDAYLALIFLTDADDVTPGLSGEDFYQKLLDLKNGDRSKILIAAALPDIKNTSSDCSKDGRGPIQSFPAFLLASGGILADLCSENFGTRLADFGKLLLQRMTNQKFSLNFTPDISSLKVSFGLPNSKESDRVFLHRGQGGYYFDPEKNEISLSPYLNLPSDKNMVLFIGAKPVDLSQYRNGHIELIN